MENDTFAGSASPPTNRLATAFETQNPETIYHETFRFATRRARLDADLGETSIGPDDVAQEVATYVSNELTRGTFDDFTPGRFAGYVKGAVERQRADFLRTAKDQRAKHDEVSFDEEDEDGNLETHDNPAVRQYVEHRAPCSRLIPADVSGINRDVLDVMCEAIRGRSTRHLERPRAFPTVTGLAAEILRILKDEDEHVWDESRPNYIPGSSDALDPDHPYGAWRLPTYKEVAQKLRDRDLETTDQAVKQHMKRLRAKAAK